VDAEIKIYDELGVGLPKDNITFLGLAKKLGAEVNRQPIPSSALSAAEWAFQKGKNSRCWFGTIRRQLSMRGQ
jgi:hypothetical protein